MPAVIYFLTILNILISYALPSTPLLNYKLYINPPISLTTAKTPLLITLPLSIPLTPAIL